jgi:dTDP-4-amino-4,6-dideoxygalactose transaminase
MIPLVKTFLPPKEILIPELEKILYSGYIAQGEQVDSFEQIFNKYIGAGNALTLNSGTAALHIALILAGVKEGDEVISTPLTAEPSNVAIKMVGGHIRYADIDINTGSIDPKSIEKNINEKTKAILFVDYAGIPANIAAISEISNRFKIPVIEDAAHALGAKFDGKRLGSHFPYTVFSFQAIKHMTTVDGGILQIKDVQEFERAKLIRWFGIDKKKTRLENNIQEQGYKYHMNNINATIGIVQMKFLERVVSQYIENGKYFDEALKGIPGIELLEYYPNSEPSYWLYTLKVERREDLIKKLASEGISASELHKRNDSHSFLNDFDQYLPNMNEFYDKMLHLPCGWWLDEDDRERIVKILKEGW